MTQRYAERSSVRLEKTQTEIMELLRKWGCGKVGMFHHHDEGKVEVQFVWEGERGKYQARFIIDITQSPEHLCRSERIAQEYVQGRFRTMLYWLRAALNAIDAGVIEAEQVFMPWLITKDGRTLGERVFELEDGRGQPLLSAEL